MSRAAFCVGWAAAAVAAAVLALPDVVAFPIMLGFVAFIPGYAIASRLNIGDLTMECAIAIGTSLALGAIVSEVLLYTELYSAGTATAILAILTAAICFTTRPRTRELPPPRQLT
jgi:hypothetical protein